MNYLNSHTVNQIADQDSFIWCATTGAVARFHKRDTTFTKFTNADGLANNFVQALAIDDSGNIWFVHEDSAVSVFNGINLWKRYRNLDGILGNGISIAVQEDTVWVGTNSGVWRLFTLGDPFDGGFIDTFVSDTTDINAIALENSFIFLGKTIGFCEAFRSSPGICQKFYTTAHSLPSDLIQDILVVGDSLLWVGTPNGVAWKTITDTLWNPITISGMPSPNVRSLAWNNDTLWAGTAGGVAIWIGSMWDTVNNNLQSLDIRIQSGLEREGGESQNLWVPHGNIIYPMTLPITGLWTLP
jgi:ligand-binding sensor domain-containing protein